MTDTQNDGEPGVELGELEGAAKPPELPWWWEWPCWAVFGIGAWMVLYAMIEFAQYPPAPEPLPGLELMGPIRLLASPWPGRLADLAAVIFPLAAINTFLAAKWFGRRERLITARIDELVNEARGEKRKAAAGEHETLELLSQGEMATGRYPAHGHGWGIRACGPLCPVPYRFANPKFRAVFKLVEYVDLIRKETHDARVSAGRLAAALGGIFIAALQIYARLS